MRILHIITSLEIGGAQRLLSDILPIMTQNHEVTLLVTDDLDNDFSRRVKLAGVRVITTGGIPQHSPKNIFVLHKLMKGIGQSVYPSPIGIHRAFHFESSPRQVVFPSHRAVCLQQIPMCDIYQPANSGCSY